MTPEQHAKAIEDAANRLISLAAGICTEGQALAARRALQATIRAGVGAAPDGWRLVPVEPTPDMLSSVDDEAGDKYVARGRAVSAWKSMLEAAPSPSLLP